MRRLRDLVRKWIRRHGARQLAAPVTLGLVIFLIASTAYAVGGGHGGGDGSAFAFELIALDAVIAP